VAWRALILIACACITAVGQNLDAGKLLVASRTSHDPDLARTVILLVHYDLQGAIGLILNRPSKVPLSDVMPELKNASAPVFAGGPVTIGVRALLRSAAKPDQAVHIFADVSMISNKSVLEKMVGARTPASAFRVYVGYTGWSAEQLQSEVQRGLWHVLAADAHAVFDPAPEQVWPRLIRTKH
jgi:putative transcriptional regulator